MLISSEEFVHKRRFKQAAVQTVPYCCERKRNRITLCGFLTAKVGNTQENTMGSDDKSKAKIDGESEVAKREHLTDEMETQMDGTNLDAVKEAARLGTADPFLVASDLDDIDERQGGDGLDGRPSPLANADNQER
jgi:hypothetical protein